MSRSGRAVKLAAAFLITLLPATVVRGFTATNTVSPGRSGDGTAAISGFDVDQPRFTLDAMDPARISSVSFGLDTDPGSDLTAKVQLRPDGPWHDCSVTGTVAECPLGSPGFPVAEATALRVVVTQ